MAVIVPIESFSKKQYTGQIRCCTAIPIRPSIGWFTPTTYLYRCSSVRATYT